MPLNDILTIIAILLSPLLALQISNYIDNRRNKNNLKLQLFGSLMKTRANKTSEEHINALNLIDLFFYGEKKKDKKVVEAWKIYLDHLNNSLSYKNSMEAWGAKGNELFRDLLYEMSKSVGYVYEKITLEKTSYIPNTFFEYGLDEIAIRKGKKEFYEGKITIPVKVDKEL